MIYNSVDFDIMKNEEIVETYKNWACFSSLAYNLNVKKATAIAFHFKQPGSLSNLAIKKYLLRLQAIPEIGHYIKDIPTIMKTRTFIMNLNECNATQLLLVLTLIRNIQEFPKIVSKFNTYSLKKKYWLPLGVILKCISFLNGGNNGHSITYYLREHALTSFIVDDTFWKAPPISQEYNMQWRVHQTTCGANSYVRKERMITKEMFKGYMNATNI